MFFSISVFLEKFGISTAATGFVLNFTSVFTQLNLCFMVFNLIPFPPLDGFKIFGTLLPRNTYYKILQYEHYIMYILMFLCITGVFSSIIGTGVRFVYTIILNAVLNIAELFI